MIALDTFGQWIRHALVWSVIRLAYGKQPPKKTDAYEMQDPDEAVTRLLDRKNWQEWEADSPRRVGEPIREPSIYDHLDHYFRECSSLKSGNDWKRRFKFSETGDCILLEGDRLAVVAFELNEMLKLPAPEAAKSQ